MLTKREKDIIRAIIISIDSRNSIKVRLRDRKNKPMIEKKHVNVHHSPNV
ncbi:hypothetical protein [Proteiniborus sp. MB09-C3]|nr:hypothetical protein [Proteiniborus sp. MB09-C3]WIV11705.1 hypothetical protein QO263_16625 [Proteiniborus sp. MB09-C3]